MQALTRLFRPFRQLLPVLALSALPAGAALAQGATPTAPTLAVKVYNAEAGSFHVNAVVVSGPTPTTKLSPWNSLSGRSIVLLVPA